MASLIPLAIKISTKQARLLDIDPEPTAEQRAAAEALIATERLEVPDDPQHALLVPLFELNFTPAIQAELERVAAKKPLKALDLGRYEAQDSIPDADSGDTTPGTQQAQLRTTLSRAYTSAIYLQARSAELALLDSYGKNAWLVGNWQLEAELKALEVELAETKRSVDRLAVRRRETQEAVAGEMSTLEETWKRGVAQVLETEVAAEALRRDLLTRRRQDARS
jgi:pre-mRNA-splicing factor SPF27